MRCRLISASQSCLLPHAIQHPRPRRVLKARQRGLRGERFTLQGITPHQQFMDRILSEPCRIVAVSIAAGNREHPLADQIVQRVHDLACLALIRKAGRQALSQLQPLIKVNPQGAPGL
jgi:hypothetical protein